MYLFALKVAGEPGPLFNITLVSYGTPSVLDSLRAVSTYSPQVASLEITTQPVANQITGVARLGVPFEVQPVVRVRVCRQNLHVS
jgi:hypothetical protein